MSHSQIARNISSRTLCSFQFISAKLAVACMPVNFDIDSVDLYNSASVYMRFQ